MLDLNRSEAFWFDDVKQWLQSYKSSWESKVEKLDITKMDVCAIIRQLFFEFDSIQYEFTDECADAREYIRKKLKAIRKRGSDDFDASKVPSQKNVMGHIELIENDFDIERRVTLEGIKEMHKYGRDLVMIWT